ncbi:ABC transporter ATP-binding protein [Bacillus sp. SD088]|uniref:ABC transporter ATP-binding protein n=1 Tax=Bacillus sp. SD088 TaxID=2782012 RepID=UPI001A97B3D6|nr:sn-glycerol-3-phosphate ABC transporter ATP-binding protein UgpC [Bacillus sp. SD088]MBO0993291.1 sn-glycerol-3-phosphate ABC transporter ATP-binding protein UgpC [Bacillus sp. SD088]
MSKIEMLNITKQFDDKGGKVIHNFNLEIKEKEFIVFVGPSGCGKSTTLRMLAGLESISGGELWIDKKLVNKLPPKDRDIAMVFQNYALFPHLTVFDNIAFGLKIRKEDRKVIKEKVHQTAEILGLTPYLKRKPKALSGGQRQRVALGRAIVRDVNIFLMDEPLSNLDAKLRIHMRKEIINLHRRLGTTTIYVTHDQTEAMTMASRIVILNKGNIEQIGTPKEVYNHPHTKFVASFIGAPPMNFLDGQIEGNELTLLDGTSLGQISKDLDHTGNVSIGIRPEDIYLSKSSKGIEMKVEYIELMGADLNVHGQINSADVIFRLDPETDIKENDVVHLEIPARKIHLFDPKTEHSLYYSKGVSE